MVIARRHQPAVNQILTFAARALNVPRVLAIAFAPVQTREALTARCGRLDVFIDIGEGGIAFCVLVAVARWRYPQSQLTVAVAASTYQIFVLGRSLGPRTSPTASVVLADASFHIVKRTGERCESF